MTSPAGLLGENRSMSFAKSDAARNNRIVYTRPIPNRPVERDRQLAPIAKLERRT